MTLKHQLDSLIVYDPDRSASTVNVWVAHPTPSEEQQLGTLFLVSGIDTKSRSNHEVLNVLQEELKHQYYQGHDENVEATFEVALQRTNQRLHQLILQGVGQWVDHAHMVIGVQWREQLYLSCLGTMHGFLVRRERLHDILGQPSGQKANPLRLFDQVISGRLEAGDRLLFCTPALLDYFSMEKLRRTVLDYPPAQAARELETTLLGTEARVAFAALLMQLMPEEDPVAASHPLPTSTLPSNRISPQLSMDQLRSQEQRTESILSPSVWPSIHQFGSRLKLRLSSLVRQASRRPPRRSIPDQPLAPQPAARPSAGTGTGRLTNAWQRMRQAFPMPKPQSLQISAPSLRAPRRFGISAALDSLVRWFRRLAPSQRWSVIGMLAVVLFFSTSLARTGGLLPSQQTANVEATVAQIEERLGQADAALLFGGDDLAKQHLAAAQKLFDQLPDRTKQDKATRKPLAAHLAKVTQQLTKLTTLTDPSPVLNIAAEYPELSPTETFFLNGKFIVVDDRRATAVIASATTPSDTTSSTNSLDTGALVAGTVSGQDILFLTERDTVVAFNPAKKTWTPLDAQLPKQNPTLVAIANFQSRLYALDTANQSILRFSRSATSLGAGSNWQTVSLDLRDGIDLAVDGSIYVLHRDGRIEKLFGGRPATFALDTVDPALTQPTKLWTDENSTYLYVLEPASQRLLVFTKEGKLLAQFQSPTWTTLRDFSVDEANKTAYVLAGTSLYSVSLP